MALGTLGLLLAQDYRFEIMAALGAKIFENRHRTFLPDPAHDAPGDVLP